MSTEKTKHMNPYPTNTSDLCGINCQRSHFLSRTRTRTPPLSLLSHTHILNTWNLKFLTSTQHSTTTTTTTIPKLTTTHKKILKQHQIIRTEKMKLVWSPERASKAYIDTVQSVSAQLKAISFIQITFFLSFSNSVHLK